MKAFRCLLLLQASLLLALRLAAQTPEIDSLKALLAVAQEDTVRMNLEASLAQKLMRMDAAQTELYAQKVLDREARYPDEKAMGFAHLAMGEVLSIRGRYSDQVNHLYVARHIFQRTHQNAGLIDTYNHLAGLFYNLGVYDQAIEYWQETLRLSLEMDDKKSVAIVLNNLGSVLIQQGKLDAAWVKLDSARTMQEQYGYSRVIATIFANQGEILTLQGKLEEAEPYLQRSVHLADSFHAKVHLAGNLTTLGNLHLRQGKPEAALEDLKRALAAAREVEALPREAEALIGMAKAWMDMKVQDSANHYFLLYSAANDTLRANANFSSITKDLFEREQEMIQERERLEAERQAQIGREQRLLLLSGLALLGMAAIFLFWRLRARRRMALDLERLVEERTAALRLANADLNKFLHQSSHDLRSPLTTILGLADVALTEPGKERHYIQLMRGRAAHLDYAYTSLIQTLTLREREPVSAQVDLAALVRAQLLEAERLRPGRKAQLDLRVQEGTSVTADPYLLGVILRNLLLNGLDFAAEGETAQLELSFGKAEGSWWLRLRDAGEPVQEEVRKRMFEMFYRGSNRSQGTGLGLYNARLAAEKLGGSLEVEATEKGNAFRFEMRLA